LTEAIDCHRRAVKLTPPSESLLVPRLSDLASALVLHFERSEDISSLNEAIKSYRKVVKLVSTDDPSFLPLLDSLATALESRYERSRTDVDFRDAKGFRRQLAKTNTRRQDEITKRLDLVGKSLDPLFKLGGTYEELVESINSHRDVLQVAPPNHVNIPVWLSNLGLLLDSFYDDYRKMEDLDEAISCHRRSVELTTIDHADLAPRLVNLGHSLQIRFARTDKRRVANREDVDEAIRNYQQAITLAHNNNASVPLWYTSQAVSLASRFQRYGDNADVDGAMKCYIQAITLAPKHIELGTWRGTLSGLLMEAFRRYGDGDDLEKAVMYSRDGVESEPTDVSTMLALLDKLAIVLSLRYQQFANRDDLDESLKCNRRAIKIIPPLDMSRSLFSLNNNLAISLEESFKLSGNDDELKEAIELCDRAKSLAPSDSDRRCEAYYNHAHALYLRFGRSGTLHDLEQAIYVCNQGVRMTRKDDPTLSARLYTMGSWIESNFKLSGNSADMEEAMAIYKRGQNLENGAAQWKFRCAVNLARLAHSTSRFLPALEAYTSAIDLLSRVAWLGQSVQSRQKALGDVPTGFAADAAACAIELGQLEQAIELLDHGRSVFWSQAMAAKTELTDLQLVDPALAAKLERVAISLEAGTYGDSSERRSSPIAAGSSGGETDEHRRLTREWESLLETVRKIDGFEDFLRPLTFSQLRVAAVAGPVVVANLSTYRCDAILVQTDNPVQLVPLPDITLDEVSKLAQQFRVDQSGRNSLDFRKSLQRSLPILWRSIVYPVLQGLGYDEPLQETGLKPRMWWCPTGPLSFLPIHAAGPYSKNGGPDLTKRVVSSYTNTLGALRRARLRNPNHDTIRMLVVGQSGTPGQNQLPYVLEEVETTCEMALSHGVVVTRLEGTDAKRNSVAEKLKDVNCAHFACHGHQDQTDNALSSALFLDDGPLSLSTIASYRIINADFAFLSACESASGSNILPDEAMHIAAGMQVAGFRSVIATMWAMGDSTGPTAAKTIYERLFRNAPQRFDSSEAAYALNEAVQVLRKADRKTTTEQWAPFIHIGI
jgi:tetratricopeptide (TPR) repeat protein/CHAT domain-containing protein